MTVREYADIVGITVQAAHKRIQAKDRAKKYPEIVKVTRLTKTFFTLKVNVGLIS